MKKILVLALLLFSFCSAKSQTKEETEKWLEEKLYAFGSYDNSSEAILLQEVIVRDCEIIITLGGPYVEGIQTIPINSSLVLMSDGFYHFKGEILGKWLDKITSVERGLTSGRTRNYKVPTSFLRLSLQDDMLERIQKALEYYRKLCGVDNEPF